MLGQCPGPRLLAQHLAVPRAHPHSQQTAQVPEATKLQQCPTLLFRLPSRSSPREGPHQHSQAALTPMWPPALWRAEDAHHLHVPLLQPPLQPCPGWGDVVPSSSLADVRSHHHPQTMAEPLVPSATDIQSIHAPCFCKEGN